MRRLKCPRCSAVVDVPAGARPSCPACGFGRQAAPAPPAAPLPMGGPAPGGRKGLVLALALVALLAVGATAVAAWALLKVDAPGDTAPPAYTEDEARGRILVALDTVIAAAQGNASRDDLVKASLDVVPAATAGDGEDGDWEDDWGSLGFRALRAGIEWGLGGARSVEVDMPGPPMPVKATTICQGQRLYVVSEGEAHVSRPYVLGAPDCFAAFEDWQYVPALFTFASARDITNVTVLADGAIDATMRQDGDDRMRITLDPQGRLTSIRFTDPGEGEWEMAFTYGERRALPLPPLPQLLPADIETDLDFPGLRPDGRFNSATDKWEVVESRQLPPRSDIEVRVSFGFLLTSAPESDYDVAFDAAVDGPQVQGNLTFEYHDADGDGNVSAGDFYTLHDRAEEERQQQVQDGEGFRFFSSFGSSRAHLHDEVAGKDVGWHPVHFMPGLEWLALAGLALGLALLRRR